jgi:hypothetical protein
VNCILLALDKILSQQVVAMFQINKSYDGIWDEEEGFLWGEEEYFVSEYSDSGYKGRTVNCSTFDSVSYTDWCIESGFETEKEAQARAELLSSMRVS